MHPRASGARPKNRFALTFAIGHLGSSPGAYPIKKLQRKFYTTLIFKYPDWLIN